MLIGALQLQGQHYGESYILRSNQIANYWTTCGVQAVKQRVRDSSHPACTFHSAMRVFSWTNTLLDLISPFSFVAGITTSTK